MIKKFKNKISFLVFLLVLSFPIFLNAQEPLPEGTIDASDVHFIGSPAVGGESAFGDLRSFIFAIIDLILSVIPILFAVAFIVFFWGVTKYLINADNPAERKAGRSYLIWGIIALFILLSFMGIIRFFVGEFGDFGFSNSIIDGVLLDSKK